MSMSPKKGTYNDVTIVKKGEYNQTIYVDGIPLKGVVDYNVEKSFDTQTRLSIEMYAEVKIVDEVSE